MSTLKTELSWEYHQSRLLLRVGDRQLLVPRPVAALVLGHAGHGLSDDPCLDLLRLDQDLLRYGRFLDDKVSEAATRVTYGCKFLVFAHAKSGRAGRRDRRLACEYLAAAAALHGAQTTEQHRVRSWNSQVRQFVIDAGVPHSLLACRAYRGDTFDAPRGELRLSGGDPDADPLLRTSSVVMGSSASRLERSTHGTVPERGSFVDNTTNDLTIRSPKCVGGAA